MAIRFLSSIEQRKDLSNLALYPIYIDGERWLSVDHYYHYQKYKHYDPDFANILKNITNPKEVKKICVAHGGTPSDRHNCKVDILEKAVFAKFTSYSSLAILLLSTGDEQLIEANPDDYFWGEGADGSGQNMMGNILMKVRDYLRGYNISTYYTPPIKSHLPLLHQIPYPSVHLTLNYTFISQKALEIFG